MSPATAKFLTSLGIDPKSDDAAAADKDGLIQSVHQGKPVSSSLESLSGAKDKNGVITFIASRRFIKRLKADFKGTPMLRVDYDAMYLTESERDLAFKKFLER